MKTVLIGLTATAVVALAIHGPIPQPASYHAFADARALGPVPNGQNVLSNLLFLVGGTLGVVHWARHRKPTLSPAWLLVFAGSIGIGVGSAYYHLEPADATLVWDRIPIGVTLMAYLVALLHDYVDRRVAARWLLVLAPLSVAAVIHCYLTGDLRLWAFVQGMPILATPVVLLLAPRSRREDLYLWLAFACYAASRAAELWDAGLYAYTDELLSGHAAKHLLAGLGVLCLWRRLATGHARDTRDATSRARTRSIIRSSP